MEADPNDAVAAFTEYAADPHWVASHLTQLAGVALMVAALIIVSLGLESTGSAALPRVAAAGAIAVLVVTTALQAVDGIALKLMVDAWAAAGPSEKASMFHASFAVRQIEVGLASVTSLLFGITLSLYGLAMWGRNPYRKWIAALAIVGGVPMAVAGVIMAYGGFSALAMSVYMPASMVLLVWMIAVGVVLWRHGPIGEK